MNRKNGFTLVEVLIALLIVSLVFFSCLLTLSEMIRNTETLTDKTISALISNNIITQTKLGMIKDDVSSGNQVMLNHTWHWSIQRENTDVENLKKINVIVKNSKSNNSYEISSFYHESK